MKMPALLAALLLSPLIAQAGVLYEWRALKDETPHGITLRLEFDHGTVRSGGFTFHLGPGQPPMSRPGSGLLALHYAFPGVKAPMSYFPRTEGFALGKGYLDMELSFEPGGFLSGYINANNSEHHFVMRSNSVVFTVLDANSDQGMPGAGCGFGTGIPCVGATGQLRQVPEPGSLTLLGLGLLAAAGIRRGGRQGPVRAGCGQ